MKHSAHGVRFPKQSLRSRAVVAACLVGLLACLPAPPARAAEDQPRLSDLYVKVAPITVNLHNHGLFLQITMTLKVASPPLVKPVKENMAVILNELTFLLSDQDADRLRTATGKQLLMQQARAAINRALSPGVRNGITDVFIESLVVQ